LEGSEQKFDLIVSNPPYIKRKGDFSLVHPKVHEYEPHEALYLDDESYNVWFETFFLQARGALKTGGAFLMEGHENHLHELKDLAKGLGFHSVELKKDYCDRWRFLKMKN
jgi:release factor glutamine methyltransferase